MSKKNWSFEFETIRLFHFPVDSEKQLDETEHKFTS